MYLYFCGDLCVSRLAIPNSAAMDFQYLGQAQLRGFQGVSWTWRLYCAAAMQHLRRVNFSKEGSSSTIASK